VNGFNFDKMDKEDDLLIQNIKYQAKYFLEEAGEFYPFGACIDTEKKLKPVSVFFGEEFPSSKKVLSELEQGIEKHLSVGNYIKAAIGVDVSIQTGESKINALRIKIYEGNLESKYYDFPYSISENNKVIFEPALQKR
jgi:hypothetical protein